MSKIRTALGIVASAVVAVALLPALPAAAVTTLPSDYEIVKDGGAASDCGRGWPASATTWSTAVKINNTSWSFDGSWSLGDFGITVAGTGGGNTIATGAWQSEPRFFSFSGSTYEVYGVVVKPGNNYRFKTFDNGTSGSYQVPSDLQQSISHIVFCLGAPLPASPSSPPPLTVSAVTGAGTYDEAYAWSVDKTADATVLATHDDTVDVEYTVTATRGDTVFAGASDVTGTVTVSNPASVAQTVAQPSVSLGSTACSVASVSGMVAANSTASVGFTCAVSGASAVASLPTGLTATLGTSSQTASATWALGTIRNTSPTLADAFDGGSATPVAGTLAADGTTLTATYTRTLAVPGLRAESGRCKTYDNVAAVLADDATALDSDDATVEICRLLALELGNLVGSGTYEETYGWTIAKTADGASFITTADAVEVGYTVVATRSAAAVTDASDVSGSVTLTNLDDRFAQSVSGVAVTLASVGCTIDSPTGLDGAELAAGVGVTVTFTCAGDASLPDDLAADVDHGEPVTASVEWSLVASHHSTATLTDALGDATAVPLSATASEDGSVLTATYTASIGNATAGACATRSNTAYVNGDDGVVLDDARADVAVCRPGPGSGGFTIGFWQNKNGQKAITEANTTGGLAAALVPYAPVFATPPPAATSDLVRWVTEIIKKASADDARLMFRAQLLATALSLHTNHGGLQAASVYLGPNSCRSVQNLLVDGVAMYATATRAQLLEQKDVYDNINNNRLLFCPQV